MGLSSLFVVPNYTRNVHPFIASSSVSSGPYTGDCDDSDEDGIEAVNVDANIGSVFSSTTVRVIVTLRSTQLQVDREPGN